MDIPVRGLSGFRKRVPHDGAACFAAPTVETFSIGSTLPMRKWPFGKIVKKKWAVFSECSRAGA